MHLNRYQPAQSLLEAIIAIGVILTATISASTLIVTTISAGQSSTDRIQAANLAREGVEVVREIRDSNWMKRAQNVCDGLTANCNAVPPTATTTRWDDTPFSDLGYVPLGGITAKCYFAVYAPTFGWSLNADSTPCVTTHAGAEINQVTENGQTYLTNQFCPGGNGSSTCSRTKYSRIISIKLATEATTGDYLDVTSTVTWSNHGNKTLSVTERLYDWR